MTTRFKHDPVRVVLEALQQNAHHLLRVGCRFNTEDVFAKGEDVSWGESSQTQVQPLL